jgi:hypothetical protein
MIRSCLIEPLVKPLVGRGSAGVGRRSALSRGKILSTCLALTALASVTTAADAREMEAELQKSQIEATVKPNAHRAPKLATQKMLDRFLSLVARREDDIVRRPALSPDFERVALEVDQRRSRLRPLAAHARGAAGLWLARRTERLRAGADSTFLLFGSGVHLSGIPTS